MKLNTQQIKTYQEKGFLIMDNLFSPDEITELKEAADKFEELKHLPNVICEKNGNIRSVFAPHQSEYVYDWLYRQERLVQPARQLIGNEVYLYQYKLNNKKGFGGDWWEWHQDFPFWHKDDGVKAPNMLSAMILFQDTESIQGPLMFLSGSHRQGIADFEDKLHLQNGNDLKDALSADLKYTVNKELLKKLAQKSEIIEGKGAVGTCVFFHANLFHASNSNISPFDRYTAILTYNAIDNLPEDRVDNRPEYVCSRDFKAINPISSPLKININE